MLLSSVEILKTKLYSTVFREFSEMSSFVNIYNTNLFLSLFDLCFVVLKTDHMNWPARIPSHTVVSQLVMHGWGRACRVLLPTMWHHLHLARQARPTLQFISRWPALGRYPPCHRHLDHIHREQTFLLLFVTCFLWLLCVFIVFLSSYRTRLGSHSCFFTHIHQ